VKTRVYVTIDTECAEERIVSGKPVGLQGYDVRVWGRFRNQRRDLGIGLIMDELEAEGLRGTFYTEALGSHTFGKAGLEEAVRTMVGRGHDVQLHTHPIQRVGDYRTRGVPAVSDDIGKYDEAGQVALLREGIEILESCGAPGGSVLSFRAGNFGASNTTWSAMAQAGLVVSSNYNPCYFEKNCKMRSDRASPGLFDTGAGVWELPIANFRDVGGGFRHLQITAVSLAETKRFLLDANARGIREVTLVTHSFELGHIDDPAERRGRINTVNWLRLRGLCRFLGRNRDLFEVDTAGALAARIKDGRETPAARGAGEYPSGRARDKARRLVEQAYKRLEARVRFPVPGFGSNPRA
jgi:hypothetical protein